MKKYIGVLLVVLMGSVALAGEPPIQITFPVEGSASTTATRSSAVVSSAVKPGTTHRRATGIQCPLVRWRRLGMFSYRMDRNGTRWRGNPTQRDV